MPLMTKIWLFRFVEIARNSPNDFPLSRHWPRTICICWTFELMKLFEMTGSFALVGYRFKHRCLGVKLNHCLPLAQSNIFSPSLQPATGFEICPATTSLCAKPINDNSHSSPVACVDNAELQARYSARLLMAANMSTPTSRLAEPGWKAAVCVDNAKSATRCPLEVMLKSWSATPGPAVHSQALECV